MHNYTTTANEDNQSMFSDISSDSEHGANDQFTHHNENTKNYQIKVMISFHTLMANCNNSTIPENDMNVSIF